MKTRFVLSLMIYVLIHTACTAGGSGSSKFDLTGDRNPSLIRGCNYSPANAMAYKPDGGWWLQYDSTIIAFDLNLARSLNLNQVRVFVPYEAYREGKERLALALRHFVRDCSQRGIGVMPVVGNGPWVKDSSLRTQAVEWARFLVNTLSDEPGLAFWDVMNEPDWPPTPMELVRTKTDNAVFMARTFRTLDPNTPITIGWAFVDGMAEHTDEVDVLQFHDYMPTRGKVRASIARAKACAARVGKPLINGELGCIARANPYDVTLEEHARAHVGWYIWELMIVRGGWGPVHGVFYEDGTVRDPSIAAALMGWYRKRSADIVPTLPDREGWVSRTVDSASAWQKNPQRTWSTGLDIAETCANILEAAEIAPMKTLPTWEVDRLRSGKENLKALSALLDRFRKLLDPCRIPRDQWQ
jgi:hypothetical protein